MPSGAFVRTTEVAILYLKAAMTGTENLKNSKRRASSAGSGLQKNSSKRRKTTAMRHFDVDSEDERLKQRLNAKFSVKHKKISEDAQGCYLQRSSGKLSFFGPHLQYIYNFRNGEEQRWDHRMQRSERRDEGNLAGWHLASHE